MKFSKCFAIAALALAACGAVHAQATDDSLLRWKADAVYWFQRCEETERQRYRWNCDAVYWFQRCEAAEKALATAQQQVAVNQQQETYATQTARTQLTNLRNDLAAMSPGSLTPVDPVIRVLDNILALMGW